ncbi:MAG: hypothetical protein NC818_05645 [Candidatus Omnitrophica bacterium]|nr:hypothetical protein [Candidatus Omnitrophota bacterium]
MKTKIFLGLAMLALVLGLTFKIIISEQSVICRRIKDAKVSYDGLSQSVVIIPVFITHILPPGFSDISPFSIVYVRIPVSDRLGFIARLKGWLKGEITFREFLGKEASILKNNDEEFPVEDANLDYLILEEEVLARLLSGGAQMGIPPAWFRLWWSKHVP